MVDDFLNTRSARSSRILLKYRVILKIDGFDDNSVNTFKSLYSPIYTAGLVASDIDA